VCLFCHITLVLGRRRRTRASHCKHTPPRRQHRDPWPGCPGSWGVRTINFDPVTVARPRPSAPVSFPLESFAYIYIYSPNVNAQSTHTRKYISCVCVCACMCVCVYDVYTRLPFLFSSFPPVRGDFGVRLLQYIYIYIIWFSFWIDIILLCDVGIYIYIQYLVRYSSLLCTGAAQRALNVCKYIICICIKYCCIHIHTRRGVRAVYSTLSISTTAVLYISQMNSLVCVSHIYNFLEKLFTQNYSAEITQVQLYINKCSAHNKPKLMYIIYLLMNAIARHNIYVVY